MKEGILIELDRQKLQNLFTIMSNTNRLIRIRFNHVRTIGDGLNQFFKYDSSLTSFATNQFITIMTDRQSSRKAIAVSLTRNTGAYRFTLFRMDLLPA